VSQCGSEILTDFGPVSHLTRKKQRARKGTPVYVKDRVARFVGHLI
jgi:hypothetical protein